jgi:hypothetical protein
LETDLLLLCQRILGSALSVYVWRFTWKFSVSDLCWKLKIKNYFPKIFKNFFSFQISKFKIKLKEYFPFFFIFFTLSYSYKRFYIFKHSKFSLILQNFIKKILFFAKVYCTSCSQAVSQPSTKLAWCCLTLVF